MSRRAATVGCLLMIVGLVAPMVVVSAPLGFVSGTSEMAPASDAGFERVSDESRLRGGASSAQIPFAIGDDRFDRTLFEITVYENQSAQWRFQYTQRLENDTEETNFKAYAAEFRENETDLYRQFVSYAGELARTGTNVTGRQMNATDFARDARTGTLDNLGIVEMSFTWTNFAEQRQTGGVLVSDVFEGGLAIRADQQLRFVAGPNLTFDSVEPSPSNTSGLSVSDSESVEWVGEYSFADQRPRVAFSPITAETTTEREGTTTEREGTTTESTDVTTSNGSETTVDRTASDRATTTEPQGGFPGGATTDTTATTVAGDGSAGGPGLGGMLVGLVVITLVVVIATWRGGYFDVGEGEASPGAGGGDDGDGSDANQPADGSAEATAETGGQAVTGAALLSDDDRVRQLLEDNGGRMKQTAIVEATEWSKSKVSMLLSEMEDDGEITKLRVGRENIVSLPGSEPAAAGSPFDDLDEDE